MRSKRRFAVAATLAVALAAAAVFWYARNHVVSSGCCAGYNVLLITLDTTRADHLPAYGYTGVRTPALDALAAQSFVFEDAISQIPITLPAHASILTGKLPIAHGLRDNGGYVLSDKETTLAQILKSRGYHTAAFVSAYVLDSRFGLAHGFDTYDDHFPDKNDPAAANGRDIQRRGEETAALATSWMEKNSSGPWFLWVHLYDPHDPYDPPEPYRTQYSSQPYDGEIAYADEMAGRVLSKLESIGAADRTVVLVTGDHGESLGEHEEATHAMFVYGATQHVPLIIHVPKTRPRRVSGIVSHVDLVPTLLDWLGIPPAPGLQGSSVTGLINRTDRRERMAYSESLYAELHYGWSPLQSLTTMEYRYIEAPHPELYEWKKDPKELNNLAGQKPSIASAFREKLHDLIASSPSTGTAGPAKVDAETEEKLRSLGYIGGAASSTEESRKIDPKDKIRLAVAIQEASGLSLRGQHARALELALPVLREDPGMMEAHYIAGVSYGGTGQYALAIDELLKAIRMKPDHVTAMYNLAYAYQVTGDLKSAEFWYRKILQQDPNHISAVSKLAALYMQQRSPEQAYPYLQKALKYYDDALHNASSDRARAALYASAAEIYFIGGDLQKAAASLSTAIQLDPSKPLQHYNLGQVYDAGGAPDRAMEEYKREIQVNPSAFQAFYNLGSIYFERREYQQAADAYEQAARLSRDPAVLKALAETYRRLGKPQEAERILRFLQNPQQGPGNAPQP